jgi:hypothetical protein
MLFDCLSSNLYLWSLHLWLFICDLFICDSSSVISSSVPLSFIYGSVHYTENIKGIRTWKMPYGINNIFHKLQEKNTLAFSNWLYLIFFTGGRFWKLTEGTLKIGRKMLLQEGSHVCIWGGLVIRGPRYELYLTSFWKCLACANFIKDLIWRVQLLNANVFFSCNLWKILFIPYGIFQVLIPFMFSV